MIIYETQEKKLKKITMKCLYEKLKFEKKKYLI